ncbi:MAG TPA: hypothetical protein VKI44_23500 [Acetobacteraceae bacterium]|nr:hypothetical protein [Acetobacteraceae bacterium]
MSSAPRPPERAVRKVLILSGVAVVVLAAVWLVAGRWCALVIDTIHTTRLATPLSYRIGWDGSWFRLDYIPGTLKPADPWLSPFRWDSPQERVSMKVDPDGHLVLIEGERQFVLGKRAGAMSESDPTPVFEAEPGDTTSITLDLSLVSFPTPLDVNWLGGRSPSWKRYLYCHLSWTKASGARLDMLWRYEQGFYHEGGWGWTNPLGGLVQRFHGTTRITPPP